MALKGLNIVASGSGSGYISQAGAVACLWDYLIDKELIDQDTEINLLGVSGGGIVLSVLATLSGNWVFPAPKPLLVHDKIPSLNFKSNTSKEMKQIITNLPPQKVFRINRRFWQPKDQIGIFSLRALPKLARKQIQKIAKINPNDVRFNKNCTLGVLAYNVVNEELEYLESKSNNSIEDIFIRSSASASIPFIFTPTKVGEFIYIDGGIQSNYPVDYFLDSPYPTIGFKTNTYSLKKNLSLQSIDNNIKNRIDFMKRMYNAPFKEIDDEQQEEMNTNGKLLTIPVFIDSSKDFISKKKELTRDFDRAYKDTSILLTEQIDFLIERNDYNV